MLSTSRSFVALVSAFTAIDYSSSQVRAQEATHVPAAILTAPGNVYVRQRFTYEALGIDPSPAHRDIHMLWLNTSINFGITRGVHGYVDIPIMYMEEATNPEPMLVPAHLPTGPSNDGPQYNAEIGLADIALGVKWQVWSLNSGPTDSIRLALIGGLEVPSGHYDNSSHSVDPFLGIAFNAIHGRWGGNVSIIYKNNNGGDEFNMRYGDGPADAIRLGASAMYRISPDVYEATTHGALYFQLELDTLYETNGDIETVLMPGLLYESRDWAVEFSVGGVVQQKVNDRPNRGLQVTLGWRLLF